VKLHWGRTDTVYAFNGAALEIFQHARARGMRCVLDQTAAPWRYNTQLLSREQARWPGWEDCPADMDPDGHMTEREEAEWELADRIICGSPFVVEAMRDVGGPVAKCHVVQYPMPDRPTRRPTDGGSLEGPLRVLFVGTLQLRKGIQYVWETVNHVSRDDFAFRAVGTSDLTLQAEASVRSRIDWRGKAGINQVWEHYHWADVLLLPTLSEGSANVCWEAATTCTRVITTAAAGLYDSTATIVAIDAHAIADELRVLACGREHSAVTSLPSRSLAEYGMDLGHSLS
jgi:glycosyltransferase involved in cell wall biosynthesis